MIIDSGVVTGSLQVSGSITVTGSSNLQGNVNITGSLNVDGPITGAITGSITNAVSASYALSATNSTLFNSLSSSQFPQLVTENTFTGNNTFGNITASNAQFNSASIINLTVIYQTSSVVYSSGSNVFGDAAGDIQTLYGTVDIKTGPLLVTGSLSATSMTGSLFGTASYALSGGAAYAATSSTSQTLPLV